MMITNATIYTPHQVIDNGTVVIDDGRFAIVTGDSIPLPADADHVDAGGLFLVPGFIDLQLNGAFGEDFTQEPASIWPVASRLPRFGVTAFLPTIITSPLAVGRAAQRVLREGPPRGWTGAVPLGLHLEGPFLNRERKGAHNPVHLRPPFLDDVAGWTREAGVLLVTLAPELRGATAVIRELQLRGVVVSAGHSQATYDEACAAFDTGIRYGTHLFNAMSGIHHRQPGLAGALLADERITVGLIADGVHVHPALVRMAWQIAGSRLNLVSDAMAALGHAPGTYRLGDRTVIVDESTSRLPDGTLAGSVLSLDTALRNMVTFTGGAPEQVLPATTAVPARLLGLSEQKGRIAPGCDADFVLMRPDFRVVQTFVAGRKVFDAREA